MAQEKHPRSKWDYTPTSTTSARQPRIVYLTIYNLTFVALWSSILYRALSNVNQEGNELFASTEPLARWTRTLSMIDIFHAAFEIIKSPVSTTALQVATRTIQVWMVWYSFPESTSLSHAYVLLLVAWSVADTVRYLYLALNLHGRAPRALTWLRYTIFFPLYPIGIGAEWWLLYRAIAPGAKISSIIPPFFYLCLFLYIPGAYIMYTYMIKQRRKILIKI